MTRKTPPQRFVQSSLFDEPGSERAPAVADVPAERAAPGVPEAAPPRTPRTPPGQVTTVVPLPDAEARERATTATGASLLVEASAGTGKTKTLIDRLLHLALEDGVPLPEIAALTFTEKAAGEMKERLREALEAEAAGDGPRAFRARACRESLAAAEIGTLHAFCARLLSERPVEAGIPPGFAPPDETVSRELFHESFDLWVHAEARRSGSPLAAALRAGSSLSGLRAFAEELFAQRFLLASAELPQSPLDEFRREIRGLVADVEDVVLNSGEGFRKSSGFPSVLSDLKRLLTLPFDETLRFEPRAELTKRMTGKAALPEELREKTDSAAERWKALGDRLHRLGKEPILLDLIASLRDGLFARIEERKAREGLLDFDDLLLHARRLLRGSPHVREHFRRRFRTLVVDEFQDTDPVQAEIVLRLASGEPQEADFTRLVPRPGALFLVGDPKQSIYRFRRADVETYTRVAGLFPEENRLSLVASFRSTPAVVETVNTLFAGVLTGSAPWEAPFAPLAAGRLHEDAGPRPVFLLPLVPGTPRKDDDEEDEAPAREAEANAIVNFLQARKGTLFTRFSEVAILVLRNDRAVEMEGALLAAGIPARLEGGKSYWKREETHAVLAALAAIDDAGNSVALATALKSFLFGHTDVDLLEARESGFRFGKDGSAPPAHSPLAASLALLSRLARGRHARPLVATLLDLLDSCDAFLSLRSGAVVNGVQGVANLERLLLLARDMDVAGLSFSAARRRLEERVAVAGAEPRAAVENEDAVRVLTIHKAKGLEFDVAVVADLAMAPTVKRVPGSAFVADRPGGSWGSALSMAGQRITTPGYLRLREAHEERERAEARRLLYVAMTRARRGLVLSFFRKLRINKDGGLSDPLASNVLSSLAWALPAGALPPGLVELMTGDTSRPQRLVSEGAEETRPSAARFDVDAELEGVARRAALLETLRARRLLRAGEKADRPRSEEAPEDQPAPDRTRPATRALEVGIGVHGAMERLLREGAARTDASALDGALRGAAPELSAEGLAEARALVERLLTDPVVPRAIAAKRRFTELPILFREGDALVEGKIDLLFEEEDGWVLVDWKTDRVDTAAERAAREAVYAPQLRAYARGIEALLPGARVKESLLVFARSRA